MIPYRNRCPLIERGKMKNKISVKDLVGTAFLVAISVVLSRFLGIQLTENIKLSFSTLPLMLIGLLYGPLLGSLGGFVADLIGIMINLSGAFHPGFTLGSILTGLLPGLVANFAKKKDLSIQRQIAYTIILVYGLVHLLLTPIRLTQLYGTPYMALVKIRFIKVLLDAIVNYILLSLIYPRLLKTNNI